MDKTKVSAKSASSSSKKTTKVSGKSQNYKKVTKKSNLKSNSKIQPDNTTQIDSQINRVSNNNENIYDNVKQSIISKAELDVKASSKINHEESIEKLRLDEDSNDEFLDCEFNDKNNTEKIKLKKFDSFVQDDLTEHGDISDNSDDDYEEDGAIEEEISRDLVDVVKSDDIDSLQEGFEGNREKIVKGCATCDSRGLSAITLATELNRLSMVEMMLKHGVDIDAQNMIGGWTALHTACSQGHIEMVKLLIGDSAGIEIGDNEGWTPLHFAASNDCLEIINLLLSAGCDINKKTTAEGYTPLYVACQQGYPAVVKRLMQGGADWKEKDNEGWTVLHCACQNNKKEIVELLIENVLKMKEDLKAFVQEITNEGVTAAYIAAQNGFDDILQLLLPYCDLLNSFECEGSSPIHVASQSGHTDVVKTLLKHCPDLLNIEAKNNTGWSAIHFACQENRVDVLKVLVENGVKVDKVTNEGHTAFHIAADAANLDCIEFLLGVVKEPLKMVLTKNHMGWNAFHYVSQNGNIDIVSAILKKFEVRSEVSEDCCKRIVNSKTKDGETCLLLAVMNNNKEICERISQYYDKAYDETVCEETIEDKTDKNKQVENNEKEVSNEVSTLWVLQASLENENDEIIKLLIDNGFDLNAKDENGWSILSFIAEKGNLNFLNIVLKYLYEKTKLKEETIDSNDGNLKKEFDKSNSTNEVDQNNVKTRLSNTSSNITSPSPDLPVPYPGLLYNHQNNDKNDIYKNVNETKSVLNLDSQNEEGQTALFIACHEGHEEIVKCLLEAGAKADIVDYMGWSALHAAAEKGFTNIVQILLCHSQLLPSSPKHNSLSTPITLDVNKRTYHGFTPLYLATQSNRTETMKHLLKVALADPNIGENQGFCPVHIASQHGYIECLNILFEAGALGNRSDSSGWTPLHFAIQENRHDVAELLLNQGLDVDAENGDGLTPIIMATNKSSTSLMELLLQHGAQTDVFDPKTGYYLIHTVCKNSNVQGLKLLIESGANIEVETRYDSLKPLYLAIRYGNANSSATEEIVDCLLNEGTSPEIPGRSQPLLHLAAQKNLAEVMRFMVAHGALVDVQDSDGWTPLMVACRYGNVEAARTLLELGAKTDVNSLEHPEKNRASQPQTEHQTNLIDHLKSNEIVSPLLLATQNGHIKVVELLLLWSCGLNHTTSDGKSALYCAAQYGDFDMVQILLYNGADPNVKDKFGFIALHPACYKGHRRVVESLVKAGSEVDTRAKDGLRPVQLADTNGHEEIVEWLVRKQNAKPPNYEQKNDWGTQMFSYLKNVIVSAFKHGVDEYNALLVDENENLHDKLDKDTSGLKRVATMERAKIRAGVPESINKSHNFNRSSNVRKSISRPPRKSAKF